MQVQQVVGSGDSGAANLATGSTTQSLRGGGQGETVVSELMARYYEAARFKKSFWAANQSAQALSVGLATGYTGICLSNAPNSGVNLVLKKFSFVFTVAPAGIASLGLILGSSGNAVTHTTPLAPQSSLFGSGAKASASVDSAATLPAAPVWGPKFQGGFTAGALPSVGPGLVDLEGSIILAPGSFCAIGALSAATGFGFFLWDELPANV